MNETCANSESGSIIASAGILELVDVSKTFNFVSDDVLDQGRREVLDGVNLAVQPGEIYGFVGLNGAGKTTTMKIALGLTNASSGTVRMFGETLSAKLMPKIGFAPEKPAFYDFLTAEEMLDFSARLLQVPATRERKKAVLTQVSLWDDRSKRVADFSKGMQQRLALACAMLHDPEFYILDEPSSGLDPLGRRMIKEILRDLRTRGKTIFFSTHILADVKEICDRVGIIHNGKMIFEGTLSELNPDKQDLEQCFVRLIEATHEKEVTAKSQTSVKTDSVSEKTN